MTQFDPCDKCGQKTSCREVFRRLGNIEGKSVVRSILAAFVLPLVVFIAALAAAQWFLAKYVESVGLRTTFALLLAFVAAAGCVVVVRMMGKWLGKK
jgi:hypothetical protein